MEKYILKKGASSLKLIIGIFVVGVLITGVAVMYGKMDKGQIDVSATISKANTTSAEKGEPESNQVVQPESRTLSTLPNGGLVGTGKTESNQVTPPETQGGTTSASTTAPSNDQATGTKETAPAESN